MMNKELPQSMLDDMDSPLGSPGSCSPLSPQSPKKRKRIDKLSTNLVSAAQGKLLIALSPHPEALTLLRYFDLVSEVTETVEQFSVYLETRGGSLGRYIAVLLQDKLLVKSKKSGSIKLELDVQTIAAFSGFEINVKRVGDTIIVNYDDSNQEEIKDSNQETIIKLYPIKLKIRAKGNRVRNVLMSTHKKRTAFINAILRAQGSTSQLHQYRLASKMDKAACEENVIFA